MPPLDDDILSCPSLPPRDPLLARAWLLSRTLGALGEVTKRRDSSGHL